MPLPIEHIGAQVHRLLLQLQIQLKIVLLKGLPHETEAEWRPLNGKSYGTTIDLLFFNTPLLKHSPFKSNALFDPPFKRAQLTLQAR